MPKRTKEDYQKIYNDLLEIRRVANELARKGSFSNTWFNGKSGTQEKHEFYQQFIDKWEELLNDDKTQSCECYHLARENVLFWQDIKNKSYNPLNPGYYHFNSNEWPFDGYNLNELIEEIQKGSKTGIVSEEVIQILDKLGNCKLETKFYNRDKEIFTAS